MNDRRIVLGVAVLLIAALVLFWLTRPQPRFSPKPLLTGNELEFYRRLLRALPDYAVFPQVALRAFAKPRSLAASRNYRLESSMLGAKHCDFLVCIPESLTIVAIVELDDRTHNRERDARRDAMTGSAGYPTLRWQSRDKPDVAAIREAVSSLASPRR